jgi:ABC-type Zn uptake system ZnuABC Zn-binding protein ZnuA
MALMVFKIVSIILIAAMGLAAQTPLNIVTSTEDLAALTREVGGDRVKVESIARGYEDPHVVEPKPSHILKLLHADVLIVVGRDLEIGWLPPLIRQSRNARVQPGADGYLDASLTARVLEVPTGQVTRAMGDVHAMGNPHYWLDPANGRRVALAVTQKLSDRRPAAAAHFNARFTDFDRRLRAAEQRWDAMMVPYRGVKVVTYHRTWSNFVERFGLEVIGYVEPRPGIPPSASHTLDLVREMQEQRVPIILVEPYFDPKLPSAVGRQAGASVVTLTPSVGGAPAATDYFTLFDHNLSLLINALRQAGARGHHPDPHHDEHK